MRERKEREWESRAQEKEAELKKKIKVRPLVHLFIDAFLSLGVVLTHSLSRRTSRM